jgi:hypothetical protein
VVEDQVQEAEGAVHGPVEVQRGPGREGRGIGAPAAQVRIRRREEEMGRHPQSEAPRRGRRLDLRAAHGVPEQERQRDGRREGRQHREATAPRGAAVDPQPGELEGEGHEQRGARERRERAQQAGGDRTGDGLEPNPADQQAEGEAEEEEGERVGHQAPGEEHQARVERSEPAGDEPDAPRGEIPSDERDDRAGHGAEQRLRPAHDPGVGCEGSEQRGEKEDVARASGAEPLAGARVGPPRSLHAIRQEARGLHRNPAAQVHGRGGVPGRVPGDGGLAGLDRERPALEIDRPRREGEREDGHPPAVLRRDGRCPHFAARDEVSGWPARAASATRLWCLP